jgi:3-hydroxyacyl-CoA dehydrogenase / enoyl-CoA hydratase / 3-hydroxybutyryl-CoA epimerase
MDLTDRQMGNSWHLQEHEGVTELRFDEPNTEVNVINATNMKEFSDAIDNLSERTDVKSLLITSGKKRIFVAGADIHEIEGIETEEDALAKAELGKRVLQKVENLGVPTVVAINGACLGGGYELALACQARIAADSNLVKIGLPEVNLGILPGFGGSIRLPKLLGIRRALPLILGGRIVSAKQAVKLGMVDQLFAEAGFRQASIEFARSMNKAKARMSNVPLGQRLLDQLLLGPLVIYPAAKKSVLQKTKGHYPAPLQTLDLIRRTYGKNEKQGYEDESQSFAKLAVTKVSKNLIKLFFMNERYKKLAYTSSRSDGKNVEQCGLIGAGVMGGGIAQLVSYRDIPIKVKDINPQALEGALSEARRIYGRALKRGRITQEALDQKMNLITITASDEVVRKSDLIIEAVVEDMGVKEKVFKEWSEHTDKQTILASNTSSLSVTKMAKVSRHPERVVGLHFFNPVDRMPLVEVIRSKQTSDETLERTVRFARRLGKTVVVTQDAPGFLVNRVLLPYLNEAAFLFEEGATIDLIDRVAVKFGMPMGPVELVDQIGIDVAYKVAHILEEAFGSRMKVASVLDKVMQKKLLGKKSGKGFYLYEGKQKQVNPEVKALRVGGRSVLVEDVVKRLIYIMINEAARCLDERVVAEPSAVDMAMVMGTGFPPFRAGLLHYADSIGTKNIAEDLKRFQEELRAERFTPCPYLANLAEQNRPFYT